MANKSTPIIVPINSNPEMDGYGVDTSWLIQPIAASEMYQNYELSQLRTMLTIVRKLQTPINNVINGADVGDELSIFKDSDIKFSEDIVAPTQIPIQLKLSDITADPTQYKEIRSVIENMAKMNISYIAVNKADGKEYRIVEPFVAKFIFPKKARIHSFYVVLSRNVAEMIVDLRGMSWHRILENVILNSKNKSTSSLYLYLSAQKGKGIVSFDIDTAEFRRQAGSTKVEYKLNEQTNGYDLHESVGYKQWCSFVGRVVQPAAKELKEQYDIAKSDLYFDWAPIYLDKAKRGEPEKVHITIHSAHDERQIECASIDLSRLQQMATEVFAIRASNFATLSKRIISQQMADKVYDEMQQINARVSGDKRTAKYFYSSIKNYIDELEKAAASGAVAPDVSTSVGPVVKSIEDALLDALRSEFGNYLQGYDYFFGRRCRCTIDEPHKAVFIYVPPTSVSPLSSSLINTEKIQRAVTSTVGEEYTFRINSL